MIHLILSLDFEFFGNGSGDVLNEGTGEADDTDTAPSGRRGKRRYGVRHLDS